MSTNVTVNSRIPQFLRDLYINVAQETERIANEILIQSQAQVPVDTGELRDSGYVKITKTSDQIVAEVGYSAPHAIYVHENRNNTHPHGKAGFLGDDFKAKETEIVSDISQSIKRTTR